MDRALVLARQAALDGEVPVAAVIVDPQGDIISESANRTRLQPDATGHAEIRAIRQACEALGTDRLEGCDLFVTLEPCAMCTGAIAHARVRRLYFGAEDPKGGAVVSGPRLFDQPTLHHAPDIYGGIKEAECAQLLRTFFQARR